MATHHRGTPTTTVYLSTTKLNSGTYLCVCRVMATSPHLDVHQQYVTEFRYMSLSCQYPSLTQSQSTQGAIPYHHLLPCYCTKNLTVLERSDLGLYTYIECDVSFTTSSDKRVDALLMLRSKGMITKAEFEQMRRRIITDLGLQL